MLTQVEFLANGFYDSSGKPLANGKVYTYYTGGTSQQTVWLDPQKTQPAPFPVILDATGSAVIYTTGDIKIVVKDENDTTIATYDNLRYGRETPKKVRRAQGWGNNYTLDIPIDSYENGQVYHFYPNHLNTYDANIPATLSVGGLTQIPIKRDEFSTGSTPQPYNLRAGALQADTLVSAIYAVNPNSLEATFVVLNSQHMFNGYYSYCTTADGGGGLYDVYPVFLNAHNNSFFFIICLVTAASPGACTIKFGNSAQVDFHTATGGNIGAGQIEANEYLLIFWEGGLTQEAFLIGT